jgi:integrase
MPRARSNPLFELQGQWIANISGTPILYRCWTDPGTGRSCRASLGTADLELAKRQFAEAVFREDKTKTSEARLATVLESYFLERTDHLPSRKHARLAGKTLLACWGETIRPGQITEAKQKEFAEWSIGKGHSLSYISRNLSVLAAAIARTEIPVKVRFGKREIAERWNLRTKAPRRAFVPTDADVAKLLGLPDLAPAFHRWIVMAALTGGRPQAVLELTPSQRTREAGLLNLNPEGRRQNKKFRPIVKEPPSLSVQLDRWEQEMRAEVAKRQLTPPARADISQERYCDYASVESIQTAMERTRARAELPFLSVYSFRHKVVTVLRKARVPEDEIAMQIGHKRPGLEVTAGYGEWSPDYLERATAALEAWWRHVQALVDGSAKTVSADVIPIRK